MTDQSAEGWEAPPRRRWPRALWLLLAAGVLVVGALAVTDSPDGEAGDDGLVLDFDDEDGSAASEAAETAAMQGAILDGLAHSQIWSVEVAEDGTVWAGTRQGLSWFDGESWRTDRRTGAPRYGWVVSLAFGEDDSVWVATEGPRGLMRSDGAEWRTYTTADGLARDFVGSVTVAPDGTVWATTPETVERLVDGRWVRVLPERRPPHQQASPQETVNWVDTTDDGTVWASTSRGLSRWDAGEWTTIAPADGFAGHSAGAVAQTDQGVLWVATQQGLWRRGDGAWTGFTSEEGLAADAITTVATADDGTVWAGTTDGLSRWDGSEWTTYVGMGSLPGGEG